MEACCSRPACGQGPEVVEYETARIAKITKVCPMCEDYAANNKTKPVAVMSCEGACLRGEIARQAANILCHRLERDKTVRICLGGAFTKDTGQRGLVRDTPRVVAVEGCFIRCASRMMAGVIPGHAPEVVIADGLCDFDPNLFGIDEMPEPDIRRHAETVAKHIAARL